MIITDNSMEALVCLKERIDNELENVREKSMELQEKESELQRETDILEQIIFALVDDNVAPRICIG